MSTVFVSGANRGIGLALADALSKRGDTVIAACRAPDAARDLNLLASDPSRRLKIVALDVSDPGSIADLSDELANTQIDVLINNAGIIGPKRQSSLDMDFDGWAKTLAVNTLGPLRVIQALLPGLRRAGGAKVMTISSRMGSFSSLPTDRVAYRSSKAAVNKAMQALASDLRPDGITVVVAHPGWVRTDMGGESADISTEQSRDGLIAVIDTLDISKTGRFYNYDGSEITW